ncbi:MAG TPA: penicillin-binding transpeptidase domain-containing protein [Acidobacteriaceae bacterium]|nr:penicillin-binding transpeptidase domain-containing protein [Acidobacteriaceae bacterium]
MRFIFITLIFVGWAVLILGRLLWLQVIAHGQFVELAARQQQRTFEVAPRRGILYDRNMHELAMTVLVDSVYGVPTEIRDKNATAASLARVVHTDPTDGFTTPHQIDARFHASKNFAWVARKLDPATVARVKALNLKGIYFQKEFKRFYPNDALAAQVLGYVGTDDNGLGGLERRFDKDLHGTPGRMLTALDAKRHVLGSEAREPEPGDNLMLSIDENIQFMAERALDHAMAKYHPLNGTIVVQDTHTGQILALAMRPTYNPNDFRHATTSLLRDHAISDVYEPGSTFKLVTYSAALDAAGVQPTDMVDCQGGQITLYGRTIHDDVSDRGLGRVTIERALEKSSDVAAVKTALKLGQDRFYSYIKAFGFGSRSGIQLPSETRGLLRPVARWNATSIGYLAIGHEIAVTPIQLVTMVSTIGNGGIYLPPSILLENAKQLKPGEPMKPLPFHPEQELPDPLPSGAHRVISPLTSAKMRKMMEGVVLEGSGRPAALNGYSAAGKTGTAQKIDPISHTYSHTKHVASFAGFAPVNNPAISVAIVIDSPNGAQYGTAVSAPIFREVAQEVLEYLGVPHDEPMQAQPAMPPVAIAEDTTPEDNGDLQAMFAEVNNLPADDPLRASDTPQAAALSSDGDAHGVSTTANVAPASAPTQVASNTANSGLNDVPEPAPPLPASPMPETVSAAKPESGTLLTDEKHRVAVPSFAGASVRQVVERAGMAGLAVQLLGNGLARAQAPAAGTMVPMGTEIVVRFAR